MGSIVRRVSIWVSSVSEDTLWVSCIVDALITLILKVKFEDGIYGHLLHTLLQHFDSADFTLKFNSILILSLTKLPW